MELTLLQKEILAYCAEDDMGLWVVIRRVSKDVYPRNQMPPWVRQKTIEVIQDLLQAGFVEAGNPNGPTFRPISPSLIETMDYITQEWDKLKETPGLGDICWLRATPAGEKLARDLGLI